jgi:hypothetical protein
VLLPFQYTLCNLLWMTSAEFVVPLHQIDMVSFSGFIVIVSHCRSQGKALAA